MKRVVLSLLVIAIVCGGLGGPFFQSQTADAQQIITVPAEVVRTTFRRIAQGTRAVLGQPVVGFRAYPYTDWNGVVRYRYEPVRRPAIAPMFVPANRPIMPAYYAPISQPIMVPTYYPYR